MLLTLNCSSVVSEESIDRFSNSSPSTSSVLSALASVSGERSVTFVAARYNSSSVEDSPTAEISATDELVRSRTFRADSLEMPLSEVSDEWDSERYSSFFSSENESRFFTEESAMVWMMLEASKELPP